MGMWQLHDRPPPTARYTETRNALPATLCPHEKPTPRLRQSFDWGHTTAWYAIPPAARQHLPRMPEGAHGDRWMLGPALPGLWIR
jgi:hypothetical protein